MVKRMREYTKMLRSWLARDRAARREGGLPWVLQGLMYNRNELWTAVGKTSKMMRAIGKGGADMAPLQPQAYRPHCRRGAVAGRLVDAQRRCRR